MSARTTAKLPFWKMHGAGNDFVVAEAPPDLDEEAASRLAVLVCDRHTGVGADGLILVRPSTVADRRMQIVNADGSDGVMCVNGIRCFVRYCLDGRLVEETDGRVAVETGVGIVHCIASRDEAGTVVSVEVNIDPPVLDPAAVGVSIEQPAPVTDLPLTVRDDFGQTDLELTLVSMGNPHAVAFLDDSPGDYPLTRVGPLVERHPLFAHRTNFEVVQPLDRGRLAMRVWERGVGETQACGSGACAAVVAARLRDLVGERVDVELPGGTLNITWPGVGERITLVGAVEHVFTSEWEY
jgi:diaminopimelate epimerase